MTIVPSAVITHLPVAALGSPPWTPGAALPPAALPAESDVLIVGAGITGLAAAMWLAREGRAVTVIERAFGSGASARSGGVVLGETLVGPAADFVDCHLALRCWVADTNADCDLFWRGCLELARDVSLPTRPIDWNGEGMLRLAGQVSGGVLNPLKLQYALADAARQAGAAIVDEVTVVSLTSNHSRPAVHTNRGDIVARHVVMAVDATARTAAFDPWSQRVITVALQTVPLPEKSLAAIGLMPHQAFYTRDLPLLWGRVMPDRSLLVGRETIQFPRDDDDRLNARFVAASERLASRVRGLHRELRDLAVCRAWGGPIARSGEGIPGVLADPDHAGVLWAGGYGGHGVAQAFRVGRLVADRLKPAFLRTAHGLR
jgi:glycine/D-amino acid oxidase-like deaminating enzyme